MRLPASSKPRPYWHVDAKWVSGILFFFALAASLLLYNLSAATERGFVISVSSTIATSFLEQRGFGSQADVAAFRQQVAAVPGDVVTPIPHMPSVTLSKQEALTLGARELVARIVTQIAEPIYDYGVKGAAAKFTNDPAAQEKFIKDAGMFAAFTKTTHEALQTAFVLSLLLSLPLAAALVYFSAGWGRLVSPGLLLLLVGLPGAFFALILAHPPTNGDAPFASLPPAITATLSGHLSASYLAAFILGMLLLAAAAIGAFAQHTSRKAK